MGERQRRGRVCVRERERRHKRKTKKRGKRGKA